MEQQARIAIRESDNGAGRSNAKLHILRKSRSCDLIAPQNIVVKIYLQDLKDVTNNMQYENLRCQTLASLGMNGKTSNKNPLTHLQEEKWEHDNKMKERKKEKKQIFVKVREKRQKLKYSEMNLYIYIYIYIYIRRRHK